MDKHIREKFLGTLGTVIMFASMFMPYQSFGYFSRTLIHDFNYSTYMIILLMVAALFALTEVPVVQIVLGIIGIIFFFVGRLSVMSNAELDEYLDVEADMLSKDYGAYVFLAGAICLICGGLLCMWFHKKEGYITTLEE